MSTKTNSIRLGVNQDHYHVTSIVFSGGEIHIDIDNLPSKCSDYSIKGRLQSSEDVMHFIMMCNAMDKRYPDAKSKLVIPYMPYARQDRVCSAGQHFGMEQMALLLGTVPQTTIITYDLHSEVASALLAQDNGKAVVDLQQYDIIPRCQKLNSQIESGILRLVSPDKGATKKTRLVKAHCGSNHDIIVAGKKRDPKSGQIIEFTVNVDDIHGQDLLIVDDICDGGGTFLGLAKALKDKGAGSISLYVTHGIFSKGFECFDGLIDHIYTSDSFRRDSDLPLNGAVTESVILTTIKV